MNEKLGQEPAFPCNVHYTEEGRSGTSNIDGSYGEIGMSKRFYAACAAMQGLIAANPKYLQGNVDIPVADGLAALAYNYADALLEYENQ